MDFKGECQRDMFNDLLFCKSDDFFGIGKKFLKDIPIKEPTQVSSNNTPSIPSNNTPTTQVPTTTKVPITKVPRTQLVQLAPLPKPTLTSLSKEQIIKAKLVQASSLYSNKGLKVAQDYLNDSGINYIIDNGLSNDTGLVVIGNDGNVIIAYRGTDWNNMKDIRANLDIFQNNESNNSQFIESKYQIKETMDSYSGIDELVGFSRGGTLAITMGNEYSIPTTTFNPLINAKLALSQSDNINNIIRTITDPVSIGANIPNKSFIVNSINQKADTINPIKSHSLNQFLDNDTPRRTSPAELILNKVNTTAKVQSEMITVNEIKMNIDSGGNFTDFLKQFSPVDVSADNTFSSRIFKGSNFVNFWKDAGGTFQDTEITNINSNNVGTSNSSSTTTQRQDFAKLPENERVSVIDRLTEAHTTALQDHQNYNDSANQVSNEIINGSKLLKGISPESSKIITESLSGASLGAGIIGGYLGSKIVSSLDPNQKLTASGDAFASGALGGGLSVGLTGAGITALAPAVIGGGLGYLAGGATTNSMIKHGFNRESSSVVGGIVGGATTVVASTVVGTGIAVASGAELGAEIGTAFAPETLGLSVLIGSVIGMIAGAIGGALPAPQAPPAPTYLTESNYSTKSFLMKP